MHGPRERGHERVLDRALPALPRDRLREDLEDDPELGPDHGADQEDRRQPVLRVRCEPDRLRDEDHRERVRDRPDEERELPPDVALDEVPVALDDAPEPDQLVANTCGYGGHACITSSWRSSSNARPVAAKNACSSVSTPYRSLISSGDSRQSSLPASRMPTRSASVSASARSWVQSRIVVSCIVRISRMKSCTSSF